MNLRELLKQEGLTDEQITIERDNLFKNELGFFSYRMEHGHPYITHFYLFEDKRSGYNFINLYQKFRDMMIEDGNTHFIAEIVPGKEYFEKFIQGCLGAKKPYAEANGNKYYLIKLARE